MRTFVEYVRYVERTLTRAVARQVLRNAGVVCGENLIIFGIPIVSQTEGSSIRLGNRVGLVSSSRYTALGVSHPVILRTLLSGAVIDIGDDVGISGATVCSAKQISIGANSLIGANVTITDTDFHQIEPAGRRHGGIESALSAEVRIGENVFIGTGSLVLKGVTIGNNSIVGAGSVVTSDVPPGVIAAGNPCRVLRELASPINKQGEGNR